MTEHSLDNRDGGGGGTNYFLNNLVPKEYDLKIWRGRDFVFPIAAQYQEEVTVGEDLDMVNNQYRHYFPPLLSQPHNKVISYEPFSFFKYQHVVMTIYPASPKQTEPLVIYEAINAPFGYVTQWTLRPLWGVERQLRNGVEGKFSSIMQSYYKYGDRYYIVVHIPHNLTKDLKFNEARYELTVLEHVSEESDEIVSACKLAIGSIYMHGEKY